MSDTTVLTTHGIKVERKSLYWKDSLSPRKEFELVWPLLAQGFKTARDVGWGSDGLQIECKLGKAFYV